MKKINLKNYIKLSNIINSIDDIEINKILVLGYHQIVDCDFDKIDGIFGREISACINENILIDWLETDNKIVAYAILMENENHIREIKNKILLCLSDKLFISIKIKFYDWKDLKFNNANQHFKNIKQ